MKIKNKAILIILAVIASFIPYTYASDSFQSFWNTIDRMPVEKRIDFYQKAIPMLEKAENNAAAANILDTMIKKYNILQNQDILEQLQNIPKADYTIIREEWIKKHNLTRSQAGLEILTSNHQLNKTAQIRANYLAENTIPTGSTHKRNGDNSYYDYTKILQWFGDQGVKFSDTSSSAFSENIWYGYYKACNTDDCTDKLLNETRSTRDFFIGEASRNWPHYRALMGARFTQIWIGIGRNENTKRYYIVVHYGVETID